MASRQRRKPPLGDDTQHWADHRQPDRRGSVEWDVVPIRPAVRRLALADAEGGVTRQARLRAVELAKQKALRHLDRNRPAANHASPVGRKGHFRRRGEDRQGWQTVTSKFLA